MKGGFETRPYVFPPVKLPLALFCIFSILPVLWSANPAVGWFAVRKLVLFIIWLLALSLVASARHMAFLVQALFLESAVAGLVAVGQFVAQYRAVRALHPDRVYYYMTLERIHGFMGHWMNFGGQQMLVFVALLAFLLSAPLGVRDSGLGIWASGSRGDEPLSSAEPRGPRPGTRVVWWGALGVIGVSIVLNFTRGVWLGCFVAGLYLIARWRLRWLWAVPVLMLAGYLAAPALVRQRIEVLRHPSRDPALSIRFEMWDVALRMIRRHPWLGVGPNNIEQVYALYLPPGKSPEPGYHGHFHNNFLQFAAERGLPCLAAWTWLMGALVWNFWKVRRRLFESRHQSWLVDGAIAAWLAMLVEGCFEFNFGTSPVLMLFLFLSSTPFLVESFEQKASVPA